jgi:CxxC-x17-CxxC domain-containing protein
MIEETATEKSTTFELSDRVLKCVDCGSDFIFTAAEQSFFREKQFRHDPKHCRPCRAKRSTGNARVLTETRVHCFACGAETTVPFKPTRGKPVFCRSCFQKQTAHTPLSAPPASPASEKSVPVANA